MKERLLVMNSQRVVQHEDGGKWQNKKVERAGNMKPGVYNLYLASQADKSKTYDGVILYADKDVVYQQADKNIIKHNRSDFDEAQEIGRNSKIRYDHGKAIVSDSSAKLSRGVTR